MREKFELNEIFEHLDLCVVILDIDLNIQYCNKAMIDVTGEKNKYSMYDKKWTEYIPNGMRNSIRHIYSEVHAGNAVDYQYHETTYEIVCKEENKTLKWFNSKVNAGHNLVLCIGIPLTKEEITSDSSIQKIRNNWRMIIEKDKTKIQMLKGSAVVKK